MPTKTIEEDHEATTWVPRPDPTLLTTQQLFREMSSLKALIDTRLDGMDRAIVIFNDNLTRVPTDTDKQITYLKDLLVERLNGMDIANKLLQEALNKIPDAVDEKILAIKFLHEEKFLSIQTQFRERDVRTEQSSKDSKVAVDAALQAAKEAVGEQNKSSALAIAKSEASTVKQIDQMGLIIQAQQKNADDKFADVKERLTRIEGRDVGLVDARSSQHTDRSFLVSMISVAIAVISMVASVVYISFVIHTH